MQISESITLEEFCEDCRANGHDTNCSECPIKFEFLDDIFNVNLNKDDIDFNNN